MNYPQFNNFLTNFSKDTQYFNNIFTSIFLPIICSELQNIFKVVWTFPLKDISSPPPVKIEISLCTSFNSLLMS